MLTDQEQDILRAALVMSCAGVDAVLKQTIRDTIEPLLEKDKSVRDGFEKFIHKRISGESDVLELGGGARFLASIFADREPRKKLIKDYIKFLTGDSLQSVEEILRTVAALGLDPKVLKLDIQRLREVFVIRNRIIHELNIDLAARNRKRRVRSQSDLLENADLVLNNAHRGRSGRFSFLSSGANRFLLQRNLRITDFSANSRAPSAPLSLARADDKATIDLEI